MCSEEMVIKAFWSVRGGSDNIGEGKISCFTDEPRPHVPSVSEYMWQQRLIGGEYPALLREWLNKKIHFFFSYPTSP